MTDYYKTKFEQGLEYQDFVCDQLRIREGLFVGCYSSRKYQQEKGESVCGLEIKYDMRLSETGNVYIEVAEKSRPELPEYTASGVFRKDNTWLYLIGDYHQAFVFGKTLMRNLYLNKDQKKAWGCVDRQTPTSKGFTIPIKSAIRGMALKHFIFDKEET